MGKRFERIEVNDIRELWKKVVIGDKFNNFADLTIILKWNRKDFMFEKEFRPGKAENRIKKYLIPEELKRFKTSLKTKSCSSIRFGLKKEGERATDFCLLAGCYSESGREFHLFYRSVELTLELAFDLVLMRQIFDQCKINPRKIIIFTRRGFVSNRPGRRAYFDKLREILGE